MGMAMTTDRESTTKTGKVIPVGMRVEYDGHVVGGLVRVKLPDGSVEIMDPNSFAGLRDHGDAK